MDKSASQKLILASLLLATCCAAADGQSAQPGAADKQRAAALEKERARIVAENQKIAAANEVVSRAFASGNEALKASEALAADPAAQIRKLDMAIASYDEGLAAREEPALLTNKSEALRRRGVLRFNGALAAKRDAAAAVADAAADWRGAADLASKALAALKSAAPGDAAQQSAQASNLRAARSARALAMKFVGTKVDKSQAGAAFAAYQELSASETDPARRLSQRVEAAKIWFDVGDYARAATEMRKVSADGPSNLDAALYLGLSLAGTGDKASVREAATHLQRFIDGAPPTHPMRGDAKAMLDYLKSQ